MYAIAVVLAVLAVLVALGLLVAALVRRPRVPAGQYHIYYQITRQLDGSPLVRYIVGVWAGGEDLNEGRRVTTAGFYTPTAAGDAARSVENEHQSDIEAALVSISDPWSYSPDPRPITPK